MCTSERDGNYQTGFYQPFQSGSRVHSGARLARLPSGTQKDNNDFSPMFIFSASICLGGNPEVKSIFNTYRRNYMSRHRNREAMSSCI